MPPLTIGSAGKGVVYAFSDPNDVVRMSRAVRSFEDTVPPPYPTRQRQPVPTSTHYPVIPFYNNSGYTIPPFGVTLITGSNREFPGTGTATGTVPAVGRPAVYGCQSNALIMDSALGESAILAVDGINGDGYDDKTFGGAQQLPPFIALYDDADGVPAFNERWGPRADTFKLKKSTGGFLVIDRYDTGNAADHLVLVMPEPMTTVRGKIANDCPPGQSADLTVWVGPRGSELTTGQSIPGVYNDSDCTIRADPKFATAFLVPPVYDAPLLPGGWLFAVGRTA